MAEHNSTQQDLSRFKLRSCGWRKIDINTDQAINLLEQAYQSAKGIEGIVSTLRQGISDGDMNEGTLNSYQIDQLLSAIGQLSSNLQNGVCGYASKLEEEIEALDTNNGGQQ